MRIVIEADAIVAERMSGIGHATLEIIRSLGKLAEITSDKIVIVIPYGTKNRLNKYNLPDNIVVRQLPPLYKYVNYALTRTSLPIPMDFLYGRGIYIFPNYKTWYVLFSRSFTFVHDVAFKIMPDVTHPKNLAYLEANFARWLKRADVIIAISDQTAADIKMYYPEYLSKVKKIYLGVDRQVYLPRTRQEVKSVIKKYGIGEDYFVYVGNIEPRKNLATILDAYKLYCDQFGHAVQMVIIGGDGWKNQHIVDKIQQLKREGYDIYRPSRYVEDDDLPAVYSGCIALIHIALYEGYGLSLVQAQSCGAAVVASDLAVFKETLNPRGVIYVDPTDSARLARAMQDVKKIRGKVDINVRHTWEETAKSLIALGSGDEDIAEV